MKMIVLLTLLGSALAVDVNAEVLHWVGGGGSGTGDFNVPANWQEGKVPGESDLAAVNNVNKNWAVTLTSDVTNSIVSLVAPSPAYETLFVMDQHVWTVTNYVSVWEASGGRITFTNGTLRSRSNGFAPGYGTLVTNLVLSMKDVVCEMGSMQISAATANFEGGRLWVTNGLTVGIAGGGAARLNLDRGVQCDVTNALYVGSDLGTTGELVNINGELRHDKTGSYFMVGRNGCGAMAIIGGSTYVSGTLSLGSGGSAAGTLNVSGGSNTFGRVTTDVTLVVAESGKGSLLAGGGTNSVGGSMSIGNATGGVGEMTLTNGLWTIGRFLYVGQNGSATLNISGGEMRFVNGSPVMPVARYAGATGTVAVSGGLLDVNGNLWMGGSAGAPGALARLTLSGDGVLRVKAIFEHDAVAESQVLFDGGTLKAAAAGTLVEALDDVRLTAKGMVLDTAGYTVSVVPALQNAEGEAGGITKKGTGTLTLAGARSATGPVSVLGGTLVMSNTVAVSAGISRIDGTLTLTADNRLTVGPGAALAGTGSVARVTLADNAVLARAKADGAVAPLNVSDCVAGGSLTVALSGYELTDLLASLPILKVPSSTFVKPTSVSVTRNGVTVSAVGVRYTESGGNTVLNVVYNSGTLIRLL